MTDEERELVERLREQSTWLWCEDEPTEAADAMRAAASLIERIAKERDEARKWQPIDSAPKDGTVVLLWGGRLDWYKDDLNEDEKHLHNRPVTGWWGRQPDWSTENTIWRYCSYDSGIYGEYENPTHWMPIPTPPPEPKP